MRINGLKIAVAASAVAAAVSVCGGIASVGGPARPVASVAAQHGTSTLKIGYAANDPWD